MKEILTAGAEVGMKMAQALRFGEKLPGTRYYDDLQWHNALNVLDVEFKQDSFLDLDARVGMFKIGYSISPAMVMNMVGKGWFTLLRLYSPTEAFFDQTWRPGDFKKLD